MFQEFIDHLAAHENSAPDDYIDEQGFRCCANCRTRKEMDVDMLSLGGLMRVPVLCKCRAEEVGRIRREDEIRQMKLKLSQEGMTDPAYLQNTFSADDRHDPKVSDLCQKYVEGWEKAKQSNLGILFYGDRGTGKSFMACCIANALLDQGILVCVTNIGRLLNQLSGFDGDKQRILDRLQQFSLLVIDDLGTERDTSFSWEQVFGIFDARSRCKKPLIVTTNLTMQELEHPASVTAGRVYDRVLGMCPIRVKMQGQSRRQISAAQRQEEALKILGV